jgi:hypothetical protein
MKKGGTAIRDVQQKKIFLQYVSNPRLSNKEIEDAFLNPEKNTFLNPLKLRKVNFDNIYNNFERVLIDLSPDIVDTTSHSGLLNFQEQLRKIVLLGSSENPNDRSDVYFRAKLKDPPFSVNFNIWLLRSSETLKNLKKHPTIQSLPSTSQELTQGEKAKLKYVAYLNKISAPNATRDDFYLDSYIEPRIPTFTFLINPSRIIDNISRILQLRAGSEIYPSDNINKVRSLASKLVGLNNTITTLSQLDSLSPSFLQICIDLNNNINTLFSNYSDASANVREASPEIQPVIRPSLTVPRTSTPDMKDEGLFHDFQNIIVARESIIKMNTLYKTIYNQDITYNAEIPKYIDYLDIWNPNLTYLAIIAFVGNNQWGPQKTLQYRAIHLLHHFRICLDILHLLYFRKDASLKINVYTDKLNTEQNQAFHRDIPLIIYAGWDMVKLQSDVDITGIKYLNIKVDETNRSIQKKYKLYYQNIDDAFKNPGLNDNRIDTFVEVLCLLFSVNYKLYYHNKIQNTDRYHETQIQTEIPKTLESIRYKIPRKGGTGENTKFTTLPHTYGKKTTNNVQTAALVVPHKSSNISSQSFELNPPVSLSDNIPTVSAISEKSQSVAKVQKSQPRLRPEEWGRYCFMSDFDIDYLCKLYEKHCILIVYTLLSYNVTTFHVPYPPDNIGKIAPRDAQLYG